MTNSILWSYIRTPLHRRLPILPMVVTAIACCLSACGTSRVLVNDEIAALPGEKYVQVVRPAPVVGVVVAPEENVLYDTLNGELYPRLTGYQSPEIVSFDSSGGSVDLENRTVTGVSDSGESFKRPFVKLLYLQVKEVDLAKKFITPMELTCDWETVSSNLRKKIEHGSSACWDVVEFDGNGGRYDSTTQTIAGTTKRGSQVIIKKDDILQARAYRKNRYKSARFAVSVLGLAILANGTFHFWDGY